MVYTQLQNRALAFDFDPEPILYPPFSCIVFFLKNIKS